MGSPEVHWRTAASQGGVPVRQQQQQQQHNRLRLVERSPVTVSSYPCCSAAAFVVVTMAALCWHVIPSRSLFLTFSLSTGDAVPAGNTATTASASSVCQLFFALLFFFGPPNSLSREKMPLKLKKNVKIKCVAYTFLLRNYYT